ncbi:MAG: lepB [Solirubrobacteraceae bacterium]|nr:lepB [Solirubrobacteraceae bacterium]
MRKRAAALHKSSLFNVVFTLVVVIGMAVSIQAYAVKPYKIPSGSMEPTLKVGDRVLVNRFSHRLGASPKVGQVVVFTPPTGADATPARCGAASEGGDTATPCDRSTATHSSTTFIKRVVGVAGDRIAIRDGHVIRNGVRAKESFAAACDGAPGCTFRRTITIPQGDVYVMGDNRGNSDDSRFWGPVPIGWVIGQAFLVYWPPGHARTL